MPEKNSVFLLRGNFSTGIKHLCKRHASEQARLSVPAGADRALDSVRKKQYCVYTNRIYMYYTFNRRLTLPHFTRSRLDRYRGDRFYGPY